MDFNILYAIQNWHCSFLDSFFLILTKIAGSYGQIWFIVGVILLFPKKTRKAGIAMVLSYLLVFIVGQFGLKDLIARVRPCNIDLSVPLLVDRPSSFSCPSTHTAWAFAAATAIFMYHKKSGIGVGIVAFIIGFSRLYFFVHFPTDVLVGILLGILCGVGSALLVNFLSKKIAFKKLASADGTLIEEQTEEITKCSSCGKKLPTPYTVRLKEKDFHLCESCYKIYEDMPKHL